MQGATSPLGSNIWEIVESMYLLVINFDVVLSYKLIENESVFDLLNQLRPKVFEGMTNFLCMEPLKFPPY